MMKPFAPLEVAQILGGDISTFSECFSERVNRERALIHNRYIEHFRVPNDLSVQHDASDRARAEWVKKNLITDRAFLCIYSEGHSDLVTGVFPTQAEAQRAGKGKNWYGGPCEVEEHRVRGEVIYGRSSRVAARVVGDGKRKRKRVKKS
jgi:hypothetical protein